jgi:UDPglucose 6-dehydrogenase
LAEATDRVNEAQTGRLADLVEAMIPQVSIVSVLGVAFKPHTAVIEESPGLALADELRSRGFGLRLYDPAVSYIPGYTIMKSLGDCLRGAAAAVIMTPWPEFADVIPGCFVDNERLLLIDCWNISERSIWDETNVFRVGVGQ